MFVISFVTVVYVFFGIFLGVVFSFLWQKSWRLSLEDKTYKFKEKQRYELNQTFDLLHLEPNLIIEFDAQGKMIFANISACKHLGLHKEDWTHNRFLRFVQELIPEVIEKKERLQKEFSYRNKHYILYITPFKGPGKGRVHIYAIDITDMQETYVQLEKEKDRALEASRVKSEFLANMSHELRTPMNGVISLSELLKSQPLEGDAKSYAETIFSSAQTLLAILNDILDISKVESGELILEENCFDIHKLLKDLKKLYSSIAHKQQIEIVLNISETVPQYIKGDAGRLLQILRNLVGNAVKFTKYGEVSILADILSKEDSEHIIIHVKDTGIGIPEDRLEDIFDKFTQADASVTREYGGTGLGLAITKELVSLMKGDIFVESKEGFGSTFSFCMPLVEMDADDVPQSMLEAEALDYDIKLSEDVTVLAVDDTDMNLFCLERVLNDLGVKVIDKAYNGEEALSLMHAVPYDVVFMDCMMPVMDGYQATTLYRENEENIAEGTHQIIIAMTANAMAGDREKSLKSGMDDHISKPIRSDVIKQKLAQWLPDSLYQKIPKNNLLENVEEKEDDSDISDLFNATQLEMFCGEDTDLAFELIHMFLEQSYTILTTLSSGYDDETWVSLVHKLKGISGNCGATGLFKLAEKAQFAEEKDRAKWLSAFQENYTELCSYFTATYGDKISYKPLHS